MDLTQVQVENFVLDDPAWLGSKHGTDSTRSIILDAALFVSGTHYPDGYLKAGVLLAKVTATGRYGPYASDGAGGLATPEGFLYSRVKIVSGSATPAGALLWHGAVVTSKLPHGTGATAGAGVDGAFDATAQTALAAPAGPFRLI